jgi:hypothetical protein
MGTLNIDSLLTIQTSGIIWQGTGSGTTLQNATTPTSFSATGLKIYNSGGIGRLATYNTGIEQVAFDTDGKFKAGGGKVIIDVNGIIVNATTGLVDAFTFKNSSDSNDIGRIWALRSSSGANFDDFRIERRSRAGANPVIIQLANNTINLDVNGGFYAFGNTYMSLDTGIKLGIGAFTAPTRDLSLFSDTSYLSWNNAAGTEKWVMGLEVSASNRWILYNTNATQYALLMDSTSNLTTGGDVTVSGVITSLITDAGTTNAVTSILLQHSTSGTPATGFGADIIVQSKSDGNAMRSQYQQRTTWATATDASRKARVDFLVFDTTSRTALRLEASGSAAMIGFLGAGAVVRQNITGTLTAATLAQLTTVVSNILTGLTNLGLTTNSTT